MRLICPCCQADYPIEAGINDIAARQAIVRAFKFTPFGDVLLAYVNLFKPAHRSLSMARFTKILVELLDDVKSGQIARNGSTYAAPQAYWQQAIEQMLANRDKLSLPIKSHGYLYEIIVGYSNKDAAKVEKQSEQGRKYGPVLTGAYISQATRQANQVPTHIAEVSTKVTPKDRGEAPLRGILKNLTGKANDAK